MIFFKAGYIEISQKAKIFIKLVLLTLIMEFNTILKGFEQDLYRIKNTDMYKQAKSITEFRFIAEKGKSLTHTEFYLSDADMSNVAIHLRKLGDRIEIFSN